MFVDSINVLQRSALVAALRVSPVHLLSIADSRVRMLPLSHACSSAMESKQVNHAGEILLLNWRAHPGSQLQGGVLRQGVHGCFADGVCWGARDRALCCITTGSSSADIHHCLFAHTICIFDHPDQP